MNAVAGIPRQVARAVVRAIVDWTREMDRGLAVMRNDRDVRSWTQVTANASTVNGWPRPPYDPADAPGAHRRPTR